MSTVDPNCTCGNVVHTLGCGFWDWNRSPDQYQRRHMFPPQDPILSCHVPAEQYPSDSANYHRGKNPEYDRMMDEGMSPSAPQTIDREMLRNVSNVGTEQYPFDLDQAERDMKRGAMATWAFLFTMIALGMGLGVLYLALR